MAEKDKFIKLFKEEGFEMVGSFNIQAHFQKKRLSFKLEDNDWDDICFDVFMENVYVTCVTSIKEFKQFIKVLY